MPRPASRLLVFLPTLLSHEHLHQPGMFPSVSRTVASEQQTSFAPTATGAIVAVPLFNFATLYAVGHRSAIGGLNRTGCCLALFEA